MDSADAGMLLFHIRNVLGETSYSSAKRIGIILLCVPFGLVVLACEVYCKYKGIVSPVYFRAFMIPLVLGFVWYLVSSVKEIRIALYFYLDDVLRESFDEFYVVCAERFCRCRIPSVVNAFITSLFAAFCEGDIWRENLRS